MERALNIYDTLSGKKRLFEFRDKDKKEIGIYTCGPTVYGRAHIGNLRAYVFADTLNRSLAYLYPDAKIKHLINITDVGHLISDENEGEDKLEKGAKQEGLNPYKVARKYEDLFLKDLEALNIDPKKFVMPRATDHIPQMLEMIKTLTEKGFTYETSDGIYFDISKYKDYGKLSKQKLEDKKTGTRDLKESEKRNALDFALWKFCVQEHLNHFMRWDFETARDLSSLPHLSEEENRNKKIGFPGWHIECSAMSRHYLGDQFDIHTGGIDHIPVHHENEIAQSEAYLGKPNVNYWMHNEFVLVNGGKMSKSKGNVYTLDDLESKSSTLIPFRGVHLRYYFLQTKYNHQLNFTLKILDRYKWNYEALIREICRNIIQYNDLEVDQREANLAKQKIEGLLDQAATSLNTAHALEAAHSLTYYVTMISNATLKELVGKIDQLTGLSLAEDIERGLEFVSLEAFNIPIEVLGLNSHRQIARENKDWETADRLREEIESNGYTIEDKADGTSIILPDYWEWK